MPSFAVVSLFACVTVMPWVAEHLSVVLHEPWNGLSAAVPALGAVRRSRGRPRKFDEPSRTLTLTLPESVLAALASIHADISKAIVRLTKRTRRGRQRKAADLLVFGERAVITIRPTPSLELRAGVQLMPLPDGRALILLDEPTSVSALQLSLQDALEDADMDVADRAVYQNLRDLLRDARRSSDVTLQQRHIIVLEQRRAAANGTKSSNSRKVQKLSA